MSDEPVEPHVEGPVDDPDPDRPLKAVIVDGRTVVRPFTDDELVEYEQQLAAGAAAIFDIFGEET